MITTKELDLRLKAIELRNHQVTVDKAWETSVSRRCLILLLTYFLIGSYMTIIGVSRPWLNAVIPSLGYLLSTITLHFFKSLWIKRYHP